MSQLDVRRVAFFAVIERKKRHYAYQNIFRSVLPFERTNNNKWCNTFHFLLNIDSKQTMNSRLDRRNSMPLLMLYDLDARTNGLVFYQNQLVDRDSDKKIQLQVR